MFHLHNNQRAPPLVQSGVHDDLVFVQPLSLQPASLVGVGIAADVWSSGRLVRLRMPVGSVRLWLPVIWLSIVLYRCSSTCSSRYRFRTGSVIISYSMIYEAKEICKNGSTLKLVWSWELPTHLGLRRDFMYVCIVGLLMNACGSNTIFPGECCSGPKDFWNKCVLEK